MGDRYTTETGFVAEAGTIVDRKYRLIEYIGEGGTATVWKAHHLYGEFPCVVKFMNADRAAFNAAKNEFKLLSSLFHPNIVRTYEMGELRDHNQAYISMEFLDGVPLSRFVTRKAAPPVPSVLHTWLSEMVAVLAYIHPHGLLHKDIKPANIMGGAYRATLIDFNISVQGTVAMGTRAYKCPTVDQEQRWSRFADVWALAVSFYEVLVGRFLWEHDPTFSVDLSKDICPDGFPAQTFAALQEVIRGQAGRDAEPEDYRSLFRLESRRKVWTELPKEVVEEFSITSRNQRFLTLAMLNQADPTRPTSKNVIVANALRNAGLPAAASQVEKLRRVFSQLKSRAVVQYAGKGGKKAVLTRDLFERLASSEKGVE